MAKYGGSIKGDLIKRAARNEEIGIRVAIQSLRIANPADAHRATTKAHVAAQSSSLLETDRANVPSPRSSISPPASRLPFPTKLPVFIVSLSRSSFWPLAPRQERAVHSAARSAPAAPFDRQHHAIRDLSCLCAVRARILGSAAQNSLFWESSMGNCKGDPRIQAHPAPNGSCGDCVPGQRTVHSFGVSLLACRFPRPPSSPGEEDSRTHCTTSLAARGMLDTALLVPVCSLELRELALPILCLPPFPTPLSLLYSVSLTTMLCLRAQDRRGSDQDGLGRSGRLATRIHCVFEKGPKEANVRHKRVAVAPLRIPDPVSDATSGGREKEEKAEKQEGGRVKNRDAEVAQKERKRIWELRTKVGRTDRSGAGAVERSRAHEARGVAPRGDWMRAGCENIQQATFGEGESWEGGCGWRAPDAMRALRAFESITMGILHRHFGPCMVIRLRRRVKGSRSLSAPVRKSEARVNVQAAEVRADNTRGEGATERKGVLRLRRERAVGEECPLAYLVRREPDVAVRITVARGARSAIAGEGDEMSPYITRRVVEFSASRGMLGVRRGARERSGRREAGGKATSRGHKVRGGRRLGEEATASGGEAGVYGDEASAARTRGSATRRSGACQESIGACVEARSRRFGNGKALPVTLAPKWMCLRDIERGTERVEEADGGTRQVHHRAMRPTRTAKGEVEIIVNTSDSGSWADDTDEQSLLDERTRSEKMERTGAWGMTPTSFCAQSPRNIQDSQIPRSPETGRSIRQVPRRRPCAHESPETSSRLQSNFKSSFPSRWFTNTLVSIQFDAAERETQPSFCDLEARTTTTLRKGIPGFHPRRRLFASFELPRRPALAIPNSESLNFGGEPATNAP
ncbi:hypothetical protein K438DRAFT_2132783 [Mycena galopus ATCC 62051]|nr:hypothetical protein K438DRAFT_2132783 [Mycena galopus ATCC 62051]